MSHSLYKCDNCAKSFTDGDFFPDLGSFQLLCPKCAKSLFPLDYMYIRLQERSDDGSPSYKAAKDALRDMERDVRHERLAKLPQSGVVARMMERKKGL